MKSKIILSLAFGLAALLCGSCRQNNGDIGDFFGAWRMDSFTVGGREYPNDLERTMWNFQNNIICITLATDSLYGFQSHYGTWEELPGGILEINYTHHDDSNPPGAGPYTAPHWIMMTSREVMKMQIAEKSKRRLTLNWTDPEGNKIVYKLSKTW